VNSMNSDSVFRVCKVWWVILLADSYELRYEWTRSPSDLTELIGLRKQAVGLTPESHIMHSRYLSRYEAAIMKTPKEVPKE
jgi:hypothetical protein